MQHVRVVHRHVCVEPQDLPPEQRHLTEEAVGITINDVYALEENAPLVTRLITAPGPCALAGL